MCGARASRPVVGQHLGLAQGSCDSRSVLITHHGRSSPLWALARLRHAPEPAPHLGCGRCNLDGITELSPLRLAGLPNRVPELLRVLPPIGLGRCSLLRSGRPPDPLHRPSTMKSSRFAGVRPSVDDVCPRPWGRFPWPDDASQNRSGLDLREDPGRELLRRFLPSPP